jgi:hypothetical protein
MPIGLCGCARAYAVYQFFEARAVDATVDTRRVRQMEGYCLKCRTKREMQDSKAITMKNGKPATEGKCPVCSTKIFKIGKA